MAGKYQRKVRETPASAIAAAARRAATAGRTVVYPCDRWRDDILGFAEYHFGITEWSDGQLEILEAFLSDRNITVCSGHKCGKTFVLVVCALWVWCTFVGARVVIASNSEYQVNAVDFALVCELWRRAESRGRPLGGVLHEDPRKGLLAIDADGSTRRLWALVARTPEAAAGISGASVAVFCDEVSGMRDDILTAIETSLGGANVFARQFWISNPTKTHGKFYDSHNESRGVWRKFRLSSLDTPNARGTGNIPGLADKSWIDLRRLEWGEHSQEWSVRVLGQFVRGSDGKAISVELIANAEHAWHDNAADGRLQVGLDPAGDSGHGDEQALAVRRGLKVMRIEAQRGLSEEALVQWVLDTLDAERLPGELPRVVLDAGGPIGARLERAFNRLTDAKPSLFELVPLRAEKIAYGHKQCHTIRAALWHTGREFLRAGGGIPADIRLTRELNTAVFSEVVGRDKRTRYDVQDKKRFRVELGRSPDRADAFNLACWQFNADAVADEEAAEALAPAAEPGPSIDARDLELQELISMNASAARGGVWGF